MPWNLRFDVLLKEVNPLNFGGFFVFSSEKNPTSTALLSRIFVMLDFLLLMLLQLAPRKLRDTFEYLMPRPSLSLSGFSLLPHQFLKHVFCVRSLVFISSYFLFMLVIFCSTVRLLSKYAPFRPFPLCLTSYC